MWHKKLHFCFNLLSSAFLSDSHTLHIAVQIAVHSIINFKLYNEFCGYYFSRQEIYLEKCFQAKQF